MCDRQELFIANFHHIESTTNRSLSQVYKFGMYQLYKLSFLMLKKAKGK